MQKSREKWVTYDIMLWLLILGSLAGVVIEGTFCKLCYGVWETHVNTIWGPFCLIYGFGLAGMYIGSVLMKGKNLVFQFIMFAFIVTVFEYLCGVLLKYGVHMKAWDYSKQFLNFQGLICAHMTIVWGVAGIGVLFARPHIEKAYSRIKGKKLHIACIVLSIFMIINIMFTVGCVIRWAKRHEKKMAANAYEEFIDSHYTDDMMKERFCEWEFLD